MRRARPEGARSDPSPERFLPRGDVLRAERCPRERSLDPAEDLRSPREEQDVGGPDRMKVVRSEQRSRSLAGGKDYALIEIATRDRHARQRVERIVLDGDDEAPRARDACHL